MPPPAKQAAGESNVKCSSFGIVTLKKNPTKNTQSPRNLLLVKMLIYSSPKIKEINFKRVRGFTCNKIVNSK